jgi:hypothetical protein
MTAAVSRPCFFEEKSLSVGSCEVRLKTVGRVGEECSLGFKILKFYSIRNNLFLYYIEHLHPKEMWRRMIQILSLLLLEHS